jgi:hypothetical protein
LRQADAAEAQGDELYKTAVEKNDLLSRPWTRVVTT